MKCLLSPLALSDEYVGKPVAFETAEGRTILPVPGRRYLRTKFSADKIREIFASAKVFK